jgi:tetratricopeptide (TPR) repeat protein
MSMPHVSPELLEMVLRGELPPRTLMTLVRYHLSDLCPECRSAFESLHDGETDDMWTTRPAPSVTCHHRDSYASAFERAAGQALEEADRQAEERVSARRDLDELLALTPAERRERVSRAHTRFRSRTLAELLLAASAARMRRDPGEAEDLARMVHEVLLRVPGALLESWSGRLTVRALAHEANARRAAGDLVEADRLFRGLRSRLASHPVDDPEVHAEICSLEASLRQDQRRFDEAQKLLSRAVLLHRQALSGVGVAKALIQKGAVHRGKGEVAEALACLEEAAGVLGDEERSDLRLCAVSNRALCLCDLDRHDEAKALVEEHRDLYDVAGDDWARLRLAWLEGRIAHGLGEAAAEEHLETARRGFLAAGNDFNAALVSLDLAVLYLEQGRRQELEELAVGLSTAFAARRMPQGEMASLLLFRQAVAARRVTAEAIRALRTYLETSREGLALRCAASV